MTMWENIEDAMVAALAGLAVSGSPMLATVRGRTLRDRKLLLPGLMRERLPAAYVMAAGRDAGDRDQRRAGGAAFTVLYTAGSGRGDDEARRGGTDTVGVFTIAETAAAALQDLDLGERRRLLLVDERSAGGEEGTALWEQRFEVRRASSAFYPTFGGDPLIGTSSVVQVQIGDLKGASCTFAFPGVDGVFERFLGTRERPIHWRGQLRAVDDTELNQIEESLEDLVRTARLDSMADPWARTFDDCVLRSFRRQGPRRCDELTGEALQDFELEFVQLAPW